MPFDVGNMFYQAQYKTFFEAKALFNASKNITF